MSAFALLASTTRDGIEVDEVAIESLDRHVADAYLLGRRHGEPDEIQPQPAVLALHHERGDRASLLPDLEHLAARGFLCVSIDSPVTRRASAARDPLEAFIAQHEIAIAALDAMSVGNVDNGIPPAHPRRIAMIGRGLGGEVAATIAASSGTRVVVAMAPLLDRSRFVRMSDHPLAAGMRLFNDDDTIERIATGLESRRLTAQLEVGVDTSWMLQIPADDDRLSERDRAAVSLSIPRTVRVDRVAHANDLNGRQAMRARVDFISRLCS